MDAERQAKITSLLDELKAPGHEEGYGNINEATHTSAQGQGYNFRHQYENNLEGNLMANQESPDEVVLPGLQRNRGLDEAILQDRLSKKANSARYQRMLSFRKKLPAYSCRKAIMDLISSNQVQLLNY